MNDKIAGVTIAMGGQTFVVPPLSFAQVKRLKKELSVLGGAAGTSMPGFPGVPGSSEDLYDALTTVVTEAMGRNYPDIIREQVEDLLDMRNMPLVMAAVMGQDLSNPKPTSQDLSNETPTGETA